MRSKNKITIKKTSSIVSNVIRRKSDFEMLARQLATYEAREEGASHVSKEDLKKIAPLPWFFRPSAVFSRELTDSAKENRRKEFETYLQSLVTRDAMLTRENYYFAFVFLELPLSVYKNWYLYSERYSNDDKQVKM